MDTLDQILDASYEMWVSELTALMGSVNKEYPAIGRQGIQAFPEAGSHYAETYPADEQYNPRPGVPSIGVRPEGLRMHPADLKNLLGGESLHILGGVNAEGRPNDPEWMRLKHQFLNALTPEQLTVDRFAYQNPEANPDGRERPFDRWMMESRLDAYLRPGAGFPTSQGTDPEWFFYTPEQINILSAMQAYLRR